MDSPEIGEGGRRTAGPSMAHPTASRGRRDRSAPPDFLSRVAASIHCMCFLFKENHKEANQLR